MNTFCKKINLPFEPLHEVFDVYDPKRPRNLNKQYANLEYVHLAFLNPKLKEFMDNLSVKINLIDIFYCNPYDVHPIHVDQPHVEQFTKNDYVRINWIYGGVDSEMKWYKFKNNVTELNRDEVKHIVYNEDNVDCVHSQYIIGTHIVQVGVPHTVQAKADKRYSICTDIVHKESGSRITMSDALTIFKDFVQ